MRLVLVGILVASTAYASDKREPPVVTIKTKVSKTKTESTLTVDIVSGTLKASYHDHIQRCYRERFGTAPKAKGTLKLVFGVEPDGRTIGVVAASFDKKLDACIVERARGWTFPPPKDKANNPIATSFVYELALAPIRAAKGGNENVQLQEESATTFADALFSDDASGSTAGDMSRRKPGADLGTQLDSVRDGNRLPAGAGGTSPDRGTRGGAPSGPSSPPPSGPSGRISVSSKATFDTTTLTPDIVSRKIHAAYMAGLKRCYKNALKRDATLRGKLQMSFTVDTAGTTTATRVTSFDAALDTCVKELIASWRFPPPKNGDESTSASFEFALTLVPD